MLIAQNDAENRVQKNEPFREKMVPRRVDTFLMSQIGSELMYFPIKDDTQRQKPKLRMAMLIFKWM